VAHSNKSNIHLGSHGKAGAFSRSSTLSFDKNAADLSADHYWRAVGDWANSSKNDEGVPIYVHIPFSSTRCGQGTHVAEITDSVPAVDDYLQLLDKEISTVTAKIGSGRKVSQLHVGGAAPNFLSNQQLIQLTDTIDEHFNVAEEAERTIEVNPYRASFAQLGLLRGLGFTNLQFELRELLRGDSAGLDRPCSPDLLADVFANARAVGFKTIAVDITYGSQRRAEDDVLQELECLLDLKPDRILCHAAQSSFAEKEAHDFDQASEGLSHAAKLAMFVSMVNVFEQRGYEWVGVSGFALPGDAWCDAQAEGRLYRNWIGYTTEPAFSVLGFGLGAVSELPGLISQSHENLRSWSAAVAKGLPPIAKGVELSALKSKERHLLTLLSANLNAQAPETMDLDIVSELTESGVIEADAGRVSLTPFGRAFFSQVNEWDRHHRAIVN